MKKKLIKLSSFATLLLGLVSCGEMTYEPFESLSSEDVETIFTSFFEGRRISKKEYDEYLLYSHFVTFDNNVSVDVIKHELSDDESISCEEAIYYINNLYICSFPYMNYILNFCDLTEKKSYTLKEAYDNKVITDDHVNQLIEVAEQKGFRNDDSLMRF